MKLHNQPLNGAFGDILIQWLTTNSGQFYGISAFAKNSGVLMIENALTEFRKNGGNITFIVGIDLDGTSVEALKNLLRLSDNLFIVHSENNITFHPKVYFMQNDDRAYLALGSNNMTKGGLFNNYESTLLHVLSNSDSTLLSETKDLIHQFTNLDKNTVKKIESDADILALQEGGYISLEKEIQIKTIEYHSINKKSKKRNKLFGFEKIINPNIKNSASTSATTHKSPPEEADNHSLNYDESYFPQNDIFWFETGKLTGGSRNILDLSKQGKLQEGTAHNTIYFSDDKTVKGGVRFFGLDPDTPTQKEIYINYDGVNYFPATIKYAPANSNWRIQIKGLDEFGNPLTSAVGNKMINQILLFEKVNDSNYIMTIISTDKLDFLQNHSLFWATNGKSSSGRRFGYILKELEE